MEALTLFLIVLGVLLLCVAGMAVGLFFGKKPIKHCGSAVVNGEKISCALCRNRECPNQK